MERPWIGFGLANPPTADPRAPQPTPTTLHVRLRTGAMDASDPQGQQLDMMEVRGIDIGRPTTSSAEPGNGATRGPIVIAVDPPGASITLTGSVIDWPYSREPVVGGIARVSFHRGFIDAARAADPRVSSEMLLRVALMGVTTRDLRQYAELELQPTIPQMIKLVQAEVTPGEVQSYYAAGYGFGVEELIRLKRAEVRVDHAVALDEGGFRFTADELIRLHDADVTPPYAIGMKRAGFAEDVETLVRLREAGVEPAYAQRMRELGVAPKVESLIRLHAHGISPQSVETFQRARYDFDADQLIVLADAGVSSRDTLYLREAGYDFSMDDLVKLAKWRVPASFSLALVSDEFEHLTADQIVDMRLRRVTPEMVRLLRQGRGVAGGPDRDVAAPLALPALPPLDPVEPDDGQVGADEAVN
jgi:hypothetical protein